MLSLGVIIQLLSLSDLFATLKESKPNLAVLELTDDRAIPSDVRKASDRQGPGPVPEITYHRAPHKPFLLLSVMDLIAQGRVTENLIEPSYELVDTFNT